MVRHLRVEVKSTVKEITISETTSKKKREPHHSKVAESMMLIFCREISAVFVLVFPATVYVKV